jgi:hypothetical protein
VLSHPKADATGAEQQQPQEAEFEDEAASASVWKTSTTREKRAFIVKSPLFAVHSIQSKLLRLKLERRSGAMNCINKPSLLKAIVV